MKRIIKKSIKTDLENKLLNPVFFNYVTQRSYELIETEKTSVFYNLKNFKPGSFYKAIIKI